jgi:hypothetical protein
MVRKNMILRNYISEFKPDPKPKPPKPPKTPKKPKPIHNNGEANKGQGKS